MTEQEWLECSDPKPMLAYLHGKVSDRKLRLFACACCRQVWHLLATNECRRAVEISERTADDPSARPELAAACLTVWDQDRDFQGFSHSDKTRQGASYKAAAYASTSEMWHIRSVVDCTQTLAARSGVAALQCTWLREIVGNAFRLVTIDRKWLTSNVVALAQTIYEERRFQDMTILADVLEEAGCTNADILIHCRSEGPHVRGCWVVDLLLGKE